MTRSPDIHDDPEPATPEELARLIERLRDARPEPRSGFLDRIHRSLEAGPQIPPARVRTLIIGYATAGTVLLAVGAISAAGVGPLGG